MTWSQAVKENYQWSFTVIPAVLYGHKYNLPKGLSGELTKFADDTELLKEGQDSWKIAKGSYETKRLSNKVPDVVQYR